MIERIKGALFGSAIGDALGSLTEEMDRDTVRQEYGSPITTFVDFSPKSPCPNLRKGQYCHKTQMLLLSLKSLMESKGFRESDYIERLINWANDVGSHRYPSGVFINAAFSYMRGASVDEAHVNISEVDALSPALSAALFYWYDSERAYSVARRIVNVTHSSDVVIDLAGIFALLVSRLISGAAIVNDEDRVQLLEVLREISENRTVKSYIEMVQTSILGDVESLDEAILRFGNGNFAPEAFSLSLFIFLKSRSFRECILKASNAYGEFGGATGGIGFLSGALAGSYFGAESIPGELLNGIENGKLLESISGKLAK